MILKNGVWWQGDCLDVMKRIPDGSVDMILCDLPYGTTSCSWDTVIPFEPLWREYWRVAKPRAAVVLCSAEPFSSALRMSCIDRFKYDWVWEKTRKLGFTNAKNKPMNDHEMIQVFSEGTCANRSPRRMNYFPQGLIEINKIVSGVKACAADDANGGHKFGRKSHKAEHLQTHTNYPSQILRVASEGSTVHPTQKPVALFEYLIRTYTNPGDVVLDNCAGSGTTAIACENLDRHWVCIERIRSHNP
jgi:site-specific DNA-methyltransferase (adenine-specific)